MYLRSHLSSEGGSHIVAKYTGRTPDATDSMKAERKGRSLHTPQGSVDFARRSPLRSPSRYLSESGGIEAMLQDAAKGVYQRTERLGLNQALRGAVQQLQAVNSSPRRYGSSARQSIDESGATASESHALQQRILSLESRNKALAKLVQAAMEDLNDQARTFEEEKSEAAANKLTLTVAKLQFVHVYLDNPTLPLGDEGQPVSRDPSAAPAAARGTIPTDDETLARSPNSPATRGRPPTTAW